MTPRLAYDRGFLAASARHQHKVRQHRFHQLIATGQMTSERAEGRLRVWRAIRAEWALIAAGRREPVWLRDGDSGGAWPFERKQALTDAAQLTRAQADQCPTDIRLLDQADAIEAILWWECRDGDARMIADVNMMLRAEARRRRADGLIASRTGGNQK